MKFLYKKLVFWQIICFVVIVMCCSITPDAEAQTKQKIKVGIIFSMKIKSGQDAWTSAQIASEEINSAGGVNVRGVKYEIELVKKDDNAEASLIDAVNAFRSLIEVDKVDFIIGGMRSEAAMAWLDIMAQHKKIWINSGAGSPEIMARVGKDYDKYKYIFRTQVCNRRLTPLLLVNSVGLCMNELKDRGITTRPRVAIIIEKTLAGDAFTKAAESLLPGYGVEVVGTWRPSNLATDLTPELAAIKKVGAHIIFNFFPGGTGVPLSRAWGQLKVPALLAGMNVESQSIKHWERTGGMCNYEVTCQSVGPMEITKKTIPFYNNFRKKSEGDTPGYAAPTTYDAVYVLKEGIEKAGTFEADAMVEALEKTDYKGAMGRIVFFPKGHESPHDTRLEPGYITWVGNQWQDGKLVGVSPTGRVVFGDKRWEGVRYKGVVDFKLPPWFGK
ncbi:MAG TPA: ABC transporter substrate-binding protein [Deltaproteobacteria bacterium]|nr:ABC transporter substrate-binding protein [Deltaproteobacteria bacterium]